MMCYEKLLLQPEIFEALKDFPIYVFNYTAMSKIRIDKPDTVRWGTTTKHKTDVVLSLNISYIVISIFNR